MRINLLCCLLAAFVATHAYADSEHHHHDHPSIFHATTLDIDYGANHAGDQGTWDFDGWIGGDYNKLVIKSEGTQQSGHTEQAEYWALYSRNISEFWDVQAGFRYDDAPDSTGYVVVGAEGLAPYFFETQAHFFLSDEGDVSFRLRRENDLLITQNLILQHYFELELFLQDVEEQQKGAGLSNGELGVQLRYEITRKFAPYVDLSYEQLFGETAKLSDEQSHDWALRTGIKLKF